MERPLQATDRDLFAIFTAHIVMKLRHHHPHPERLYPEKLVHDTGFGRNEAAREEQGLIAGFTLRWLQQNGVLLADLEDDNHLEHAVLSARAYVVANRTLPNRATLRGWLKEVSEKATGLSVVSQDGTVVSASSDIDFDPVASATELGEHFLEAYVG